MDVNGWVIFGVVSISIFAGAWLAVRLAELFLKRMGLQVHVFPAPTDEGDEAAPVDPQAQPQGEQPQRPAPDPNAPRGNAGIISGRCRGCDLIHVGLIPAFIELIGPGEFNIPGGVPAVCPRCWCRMNPDKLTNVVPMPPQPVQNLQNRPPVMGGEGAPEPIQLDDAQDVRKISDQPKEMEFAEPPPQPSHRTSGHPAEPPLADKPVGELTDEELEQLTRPNTVENVPQCSQCNRVTGTMKPDRNGKLWCQHCIDALGGPGKTKKKGRKGE